MPTAAVLFLQSLRDGVIYGATGQHAHGFWLNAWREISAEVGDSLHDDRPLRQFTISPLLGLGDTLHGRTAVAAGDTARLRLTTLDDAIRPKRLDQWLLQLPDKITMAGLPWRVRYKSRSPTDHPAAGEASYAALRDRYRNGDRVPRRWQLAFKSPMAIQLGDGCTLPFPLPGKICRGWLQRWTEYAPADLPLLVDTPGAFLARVDLGLCVSRYQLKSVSFRFRLKGPDGQRTEVSQIGCVGSVALEGAGLAPADRAVIATLADFAFYCGTGHHTTMGMGQTTVVADK